MSSIIANMKPCFVMYQLDRLSVRMKLLFLSVSFGAGASYWIVVMMQAGSSSALDGTGCCNSPRTPKFRFKQGLSEVYRGSLKLNQLYGRLTVQTFA